MNVLHTITAYPPSIGGAQLQLQRFAQGLAARHQVAVAYQWDEHRTDWLRGTTINAPPSGPPATQGLVKHQRIAPTSAQRAALRPWVYLYPLLQGPAIRQIAAALTPHLAAAARALLPANPDIVHNTRVGREGITAASLDYARQIDVPFVLTPHHHHHWRGWFYRHYLKIYRQADAILVNTPLEKATLCDLGVNPDRLYVVGVGPILADTTDAAWFRQHYHIPDEVPVVLFLGQKYAYKHFDWLVDAMPSVWRTHPDAHLCLIGPETPYSMKRLADIEDKRIHNIGVVSLQHKTDAIAACDVLCVPSAKESFGAVYLEAWTYKKPVIGGTAPASVDIIERAQGGFYGSQSYKVLSDQLRQLLSDPNLRQKWGEAGHQFAKDFQWKHLILRVEHLFVTINR